MGRMMGSVLSKYQKIPTNKQKWLPFGSLQGVRLNINPHLDSGLYHHDKQNTYHVH